MFRPQGRERISTEDRFAKSKLPPSSPTPRNGLKTMRGDVAISQIRTGSVQTISDMHSALFADGRVMEERRHENRRRTLRPGQIVFNEQQSVLDCLVRNLSESGACLQIDTTIGIPAEFELRVDGKTRSCHLVWITDTRAGIEFTAASRTATETSTRSFASASQDVRFGQFKNNELPTLSAALDLVPIGIVLLDAELRAQFINQAFRRMWRLPDEKADNRPPFIS